MLSILERLMGKETRRLMGTRPSRALVLHFVTPVDTNRQTLKRKTGTRKTGALLLLPLLKPTTRTSSGTLVLTLKQLGKSKMASGLLSKSSGTLSRRLKPLAVRSAVTRCTTARTGLAVA